MPATDLSLDYLPKGSLTAPSTSHTQQSSFIP